jgi:hypothetical protein
MGQHHGTHLRLKIVCWISPYRLDKAVYVELPLRTAAALQQQL